METTLTGYIARRLLLGGFTLIAVITLLFAVLWLVPGDPYDLVTGHPARALVAPRQPFLVEYWQYLSGVIRPLWSWWGWPPHPPLWPDLGDSTYQHTTAVSAIAVRVRPTLELMGTTYVVILLVAVPVGLVGALRPHGRLDETLTALSFVGFSLPVFWVGELLIFAFAIFPASRGMRPIFPAGDEHTPQRGDLGDLAVHIVLPVVTLAVTGVARYSLYLRTAMIEVLEQDYIRTARAIGLVRSRIVLRHALRNALSPFITLLALDLPALITGAVIVEYVFNWPGLGQLVIIASGQSDYPVVLGIVFALSATVILANLAADVAYAVADPRVSYSRR